jgi:hypothetical protein
MTNDAVRHCLVPTLLTKTSKLCHCVYCGNALSMKGDAVLAMRTQKRMVIDWMVQ